MAAKFSRTGANTTYQTPLRAPLPQAVASSGQFSSAKPLPNSPGLDPGRINDFLDGVQQKNTRGGSALKSSAIILGAALGWTAYKKHMRSR